MAIVNETQMITPYSTSDNVLELNIDSKSDAYVLQDVIKLKSTYTFSIWYKTELDSQITFNIFGVEETVSSSSVWKKYVKTVTVNSLEETNIYIIPTVSVTSYFYEGYLVDGITDTSWTPAPEDIENKIGSVHSEIKQTADKINLFVSSDEGSGELSITPKGISAIAKDVLLTGEYITLDGKTTVNGDFVLNNGVIKNSSYEPPTNNSVFSNNGMQIDVEKSTITSKNFSIDKDGNVNIKGNVEADSGKIGDCTIDNGRLKVGSGNLDVGDYMQLTYNLVKNENGELVNGDVPMIILGKHPFYLSVSSRGLDFYQGESLERIRTNEAYPIAYLANNKLQINQSVVIQQMDVGDQINGQWSWKTHVVNGKNNLYLKWLG